MSARRAPRRRAAGLAPLPPEPSPSFSLPPEGERFAVYVAAKGFERELTDELHTARPGCVRGRKGRLVVADGPPLSAAWAQNIWLEPLALPIASVGDAARILKGIQRNWHAHPVDGFRRSALIAAQLPPVSARPLVFGEAAPSSPLGAWTLWERNLLLASARCSSPFADGEVRFVENHTEPPSRAYLKLWEVFTLLGEQPGPGQTCLDLGSSPGGWTWVLARAGARVISVDKAPLAPEVAALPGVDFRRGSGFGLNPAALGRVDWLFSDMACYPGRLLRTVRRWLEAGNVGRFICTLKFQGETDQDMARAFAALPGSRLMHLSCNRHELTWVCRPPRRRA
ncbi:MAG: hypothetical protein J1E80_03625 [Desulfovibrionaceae bacterium]|nr:hypothetical protein [Desulfovibrionaceae bacterium]